MIETTTPELPAERCATCAHAHIPASPMPGWCSCDLLRSHEYRSKYFPCVFDPSRWSPRPTRAP
jgi:hypothetical protein